MDHAQRRGVEWPLISRQHAVPSDGARPCTRERTSMIRLRHTDEWVGLLVVLATLLFVGAVLEAGFLRDWFRPISHLRIVLPQSGVGGLAVGADVEVLGIHAGTVRRIVLNPDRQM